MNSIEILNELNQKLRTHLIDLENENIELKIKLSQCEGELKVLNQFYSDFKNQIGTGVTTVSKSTEQIIVESQATTYDSVLSEYFLTQDSSLVENLFKNFDVKPTQVLTDIKNVLPLNIKDIVERYNCKKEYRIIIKSIKNIEDFTKSTSFEERGMNDLIDNYIANFNKEKKIAAQKFLKQALIYFPFQFDMFLNKISQYTYDGFNEYVENLKIELYGKNNILLTGEVFPKKDKPTTKKVIKSDSDKKHIDHTLSIPELVKLVETAKTNHRQKAQRIFDGMIRVGRPDEEALLFVEEINKILKTKI